MENYFEWVNVIFLLCFFLNLFLHISRDMFENINSREFDKIIDEHNIEHEDEQEGTISKKTFLK
jgi:hypothetical protein